MHIITYFYHFFCFFLKKYVTSFQMHIITYYLLLITYYFLGFFLNILQVLIHFHLTNISSQIFIQYS